MNSPTPWKYFPETVLPDGTQACSVICGGVFPHFVCHTEGPNRLENARLIAAAPKLLAACQQMIAASKNRHVSDYNAAAAMAQAAVFDALDS